MLQSCSIPAKLVNSWGCTESIFLFRFAFGSVFKKKSDLVRNEYGSVWFDKMRFSSDIINSRFYQVVPNMTLIFRIKRATFR